MQGINQFAFESHRIFGRISHSERDCAAQEKRGDRRLDLAWIETSIGHDAQLSLDQAEMGTKRSPKNAAAGA